MPPQNLNLFSKPQLKTGMNLVNAEEWQAASEYFILNPKSTKLIKNSGVKVSHDFIRLKNGIYAINEQIGAGSKGVINLTQDEKGNNYVLKITELDEVTFPDIPESVQEEFEEFDELVAHIQSHPSESYSSEEIILKKNGKLIDSGLVLSEDTEDVELAIVMPFLGKPLLQHIAQNKKTDTELLGYAIQCIEQIEKLHTENFNDNKGFIHGDVSISNFLINDNDEINIIDFGSSVKIREGIDDTYKLPPAIDERYTNVPPEYKERQCSCKSDVYRLAEVLQEIFRKDFLTGTAVSNIIEKMREKNPEMRPSLGEVKQVFSQQLSKSNRY